VPLFSRHDLRHRRVSLLHLREVPWARIGEAVGHDAYTSAKTCTHVMIDETELDYAAIIARDVTSTRSTRPGPLFPITDSSPRGVAEGPRGATLGALAPRA
jgi:hypothetical protein